MNTMDGCEYAGLYVISILFYVFTTINCMCQIFILLCVSAFFFKKMIQ